MAIDTCRSYNNSLKNFSLDNRIGKCMILNEKVFLKIFSTLDHSINSDESLR